MGRNAMAQKFKIEPGSVRETLVIPLYGRRLCAEVPPRLYADKSAAELCARPDYQTRMHADGPDDFAFVFCEGAPIQPETRYPVHDRFAHG